jgi:hypothetical protein
VTEGAAGHRGASYYAAGRRAAAGTAAAGVSKRNCAIAFSPGSSGISAGAGRLARAA